MRLILVTGTQKCNTHSPFGSVSSKDGATMILCVQGSLTSIREGEAGGKRADHLERNRQQKTDMRRPFSTTLTETVTNRSGITTIS
jgi:hypothetical protein